MVLGTVGSWERQGHPSQSISDDESGGLLSHVHHHSRPRPSTLDLAWCCHGLQDSGLRQKSVPISFPAAGWTRQDPNQLPTEGGMAPAWHLQGNLSLD